MGNSIQIETFAAEVALKIVTCLSEQLYNVKVDQDNIKDAIESVQNTLSSDEGVSKIAIQNQLPIPNFSSLKFPSEAQTAPQQPTEKKDQQSAILEIAAQISKIAAQQEVIMSEIAAQQEVINKVSGIAAQIKKDLSLISHFISSPTSTGSAQQEVINKVSEIAAQIKKDLSLISHSISSPTSTGSVYSRRSSLLSNSSSSSICCLGTKKNGGQCNNRIKLHRADEATSKASFPLRERGEGTYCHYHKNQARDSNKKLCKGYNKNGSPCKNAEKITGYCNRHIKQSYNKTPTESTNSTESRESFDLKRHISPKILFAKMEKDQAQISLPSPTGSFREGPTATGRSSLRSECGKEGNIDLANSKFVKCSDATEIGQDFRMANNMTIIMMSQCFDCMKATAFKDIEENLDREDINDFYDIYVNDNLVKKRCKLKDYMADIKRVK